MYRRREVLKSLCECAIYGCGQVHYDSLDADLVAMDRKSKEFEAIETYSAMQRCNIQRCNMRRCNRKRCNMQRCNIKHCSMQRCKHATLQNTRLQHTMLQRCNIQCCNAAT